ncbi:MAG: energy-coupling factor ABC transporter permease, partial [Methanohalophilus sp.]
GIDSGLSEKIMGGISGALAIFFTTILLSISLLTTGEEFLGVAGVAAASHVPVMIIEGIVTASAVTYLAKVKPELLPVKLNK